ncbi:flagellar biosynthesis repressor FlbT [Rhodobacteraceae bacterium]|nr:flagellar biosynthesis repressor FlbT [Paracoccaceae bacterium]
MSGLVIKLGPKERVLLNGAVIENGERRSRFSVVTPDAKILRLRDALHPDQANTPVSRVCYETQLMLTGDADPNLTKLHILTRIEELSQIFTDADSRRHIAAATEALIHEQHYQCLKALRSLLSREQRLFAHRSM